MYNLHLFIFEEKIYFNFIIISVFCESSVHKFNWFKICYIVSKIIPD